MPANIVLDEVAWKYLREVVVKHRRTSQMNDAAYAKTILGVSVNTYKKCIAEPNIAGLPLKEQKLLALVKAVKLDPVRLGIDAVEPSFDSQYGGYDPDQFKDLAGSYYVHRRSFLHACNIVRGIVDIRIDEKKRCLAFEEYNNYISDAGFKDETLYKGEIYINETRSLFGLQAVHEGQARLMMLQSIVRAQGALADPNVRGRLRWRGALLTFGRPREAWQPTITAVVLESLPPAQWKSARKQCRTIEPSNPEFATIALEIAHAEEHACIMTPLLWNRRQPAPPARRQA